MQAAFRRVLFLSVPTILMVSACSPSLAPLYRDFDIASSQIAGDAPAEDVTPQIRAALVEAGWILRDSPASNVVATERRTMSEWGLYRVEVYVEAAQVGRNHVRLFIHPQRRYITGGRSKIPFLNNSLRRAVVLPLTEALRDQGLTPSRSPRERGVTDRL